MMHKRKTNNTHASNFLIQLAGVNMSFPWKRLTWDLGVSVSVAVKAGASFLQSNACPGSARVFHSMSFQPAWDLPSQEVVGRLLGPHQQGSSARPWACEVLGPGTCPWVPGHRNSLYVRSGQSFLRAKILLEIQLDPGCVTCLVRYTSVQMHVYFRSTLFK